MTDRDRMDPRFAAGLDSFLTAQIEQDAHPSPGQARRSVASHGGRTVWVTAVVGLVVALLAVVSIRAVGDRHHAAPPAATRSNSTNSTELTPATLLQKLPSQRYGRTLHTWTDQTAAASGPFNVTGSTVVIAGVCKGGGAISIKDVRGKAHKLGCSKLSIQQPFWRFNLGGDDQPTRESQPVRLGVTVLEGSPEFVVRAWAVDPRILRSGWYVATSSPVVPASLRTCKAGDLAPTGTFASLKSEHAGVVTVTNSSGSDCAVRSWPAMRYFDAASKQIGPTQGGTSANGQSLDSREGALNRYHEFPPALLKAGGHGYFIVELFTRARLAGDDKTQRDAAAKAAATPSPSVRQPGASVQLCHPVTVATLRVTIAGSSVTVPAPANPVPAACTNSSFIFGVNPVVAQNPGN